MSNTFHYVDLHRIKQRNKYIGKKKKSFKHYLNRVSKVLIIII